ncbi:hypothetical protein C8Z91_17870 [Paenibacillus elgii]|uniref:DUF6891 domain-containing protein n=1 Tax=Paenibacillus elgii TaxID=189691 RepID=A0A2T6G127_9BACL|nr:hypothetical protein [Paenibacillus elgii]PUA37838.1 hypothetical protein C8Z91_17870 [Paenibacillus elgii]
MIEQIELLVKTGFHSREEIFKISTEEYGISIDEEQLQTEINSLFNRHTEASKQWPRPTHFENLATVFDMLCDGGIIALHNAGITISDGIDDANECYEELIKRGKLPAGYCFYHEQDIERAIGSNVLPIAFGTFRENTEHAVKVANVIVSFLESFGFNVHWDGDINSRIELRNFEWRKTYSEHDSYGLERAVEIIAESSYDIAFNAMRPADVVGGKAGSNLPAYTKRTFSEIKHLLPSDCWAYSRNEKNNGEFENETVLVYDGDLTAHHIHLDYPLGIDAQRECGQHEAWLEQQSVFLILIIGDLIVQNYIYNENTDGSTGLIVLGNVQASNIIVGGQEIYICGNLEVKELFWGDYNHGMLSVRGNVTAPLFVETDEYYVGIKGERHFKKHWVDADEFDENDVQTVLAEGCYWIDEHDEYYEGETQLNREGMFNRLKANQPLLMEEWPEEPPRIFENEELSVNNLQRILASPLFGEDDIYRFYIDDVSIRATRPYLNEEGKKVGGNIYMLQDDTFAVFIYLNEKICLDIIYQNNAEEDWYQLDDRSPAPYVQLLNHYWPRILKEITCRESLDVEMISYWQEQLRDTVTVEKIERILALPIVSKKFNDYYDEDKSGYWNGSLHYCFRLPKGEDKPRVGVGKERRDLSLFPTIDGEFDVFIYHFDIETSDDGIKKVVLKFQPHNEGNTRQVEAAEINHIQTALRFWSRLEKTIFQHNDDFLEEQS